MSDLVIQAVQLTKSYQEGERSLEIFSGLDFELGVGQSVGIVGSSGAGKTTLLNILGGLDSPTSGEIRLCGVDLTVCKDKALTKVRNQHLGFVYQFHHLLAEFNAIENVAMPLFISGMKRQDAEARAKDLLTKVGLSDRMSHKPSELSGGERQRVAIARALVNEPQCVLMDEPTGNLDELTAKSIQSLMLELQKSMGISFVVVTHDMQLAHQMDRVLQLEQGKLKVLELSESV